MASCGWLVLNRNVRNGAWNGSCNVTWNNAWRAPVETSVLSGHATVFTPVMADGAPFLPPDHAHSLRGSIRRYHPQARQAQQAR